MQVVHVNLFDSQGGAARIAWTLMDAMTAHDVHIFAHHCTTNDPRVIPLPFPTARWQQQLLRKQSREGLFDLYSAALVNVFNHSLFDQANIVHLHCINGGYFSYLLLPFLTAKPTVWTLHDPLAFTAGCLNTDYCDQWRHNWCANCPQDTNNMGKMPQRTLIQLLKASVYKTAQFTAVCPSAWLEKQARDSILQGHDIRLIYNGIDTNTFRPGDRATLRAKLRLPADKKIVMFAAHGGFNSLLKGGNFLREALKKLHSRYPDLLLLNIGTADNSVLRDLPTQHLDLPFINDAQLLAEYYGAADLFVSPSLVENLSLSVCEAMACGIPVVAFAVGGTPEIVAHKETGYLAVHGDSGELAYGIAYFLDDAHVRHQAGEAARRIIEGKFSAKRMVADYMALYEDTLKTAGGAYLLSLGNEYFLRLIAKAPRNDWDYVWQEFQNLYKSFDNADGQERAIFVDRFFSNCLQTINPADQNLLFVEILEQWYQYRSIPEFCGGLPTAEKEALLSFCRLLREKMHNYLTHTNLAELEDLDEQRQLLFIRLWSNVFLNSFSPLNLEVDTPAKHLPDKYDAADQGTPPWYVRLMITSMYRPYDSASLPVAANELWNAPIPFCAKTIIAYWLLKVPYFNLEEKHCQKLLKDLPGLCQVSMSPVFFTKFVTETISSLWRISYAGGNSVQALSSFGDFITSHMSRFYPEYKEISHSRKYGQSGKIRIGYISRFFHRQAVSYYMVNRIIHHDSDKFEVYVFALGDRHDEISDLFAKYSDHFWRFKDFHAIDIAGIAQSIIDNQLDILIYTDIGMDPITYMLAGMQLAPIQCAMVGHGTTTGMPTIQYYLSGDFESVDAASHYREKLIRLPHLGAAQYPPMFTPEPLPTRQDWKIPDNVVVFISCANGIKHGLARDVLLVEILKQAPNACIVLKPYHSFGQGNQMTERLMAKAWEAGVADRLFIVPPLKHVVALLAIADIQLDTYPYGGWTTNMEALYMGLPIVTQEGGLARSRWGAHMLRALDIQEGIAANETEYIDWAVRFAHDENLRQRVKKQIQEQAKNILFNGAAAQPAYEEALMQIFNGERKTYDFSRGKADN